MLLIGILFDNNITKQKYTNMIKTILQYDQYICHKNGVSPDLHGSCPENIKLFKCEYIIFP